MADIAADGDDTPLLIFLADSLSGLPLPVAPMAAADRRRAEMMGRSGLLA